MTIDHPSWTSLCFLTGLWLKVLLICWKRCWNLLSVDDFMRDTLPKDPGNFISSFDGRLCKAVHLLSTVLRLAPEASVFHVQVLPFYVVFTFVPVLFVLQSSEAFPNWYWSLKLALRALIWFTAVWDLTQNYDPSLQQWQVNGGGKWRMRSTLPELYGAMGDDRLIKGKSWCC